MKIGTTFRTALAALTLLGAFHLRSAQAAEPAKSQDCIGEMIDFGTAVCDATTGGDWTWGIVWYWNDGYGNCTPLEVDCYAT